MVMSSAGYRTKNDCAGECQQQFYYRDTEEKERVLYRPVQVLKKMSKNIGE
jgi:hypothetical protein